jgi:hypothetical protein
MTPRTVLVAICLLIANLLTCTSFVNAGMPKYLRIFAPADRIQDWPLEGDKYLPVDAEEFERVVKLVERSQQGLATTRRCRIERLAGTAEIVDGTLHGSVLLDVTHERSGPALLSLAPWRLAITEARWETPAAAPAVCGLTSGSRTAVVVEQSGRLRIDFSLRGVTHATGEQEFALLVPAAPTANWEVTVTADDTLRAQGGLLTASTAAPRVYRLDVAADETARLFTSSTTAGADRRPSAAYTSTLNYVFSSDGVEVVADFRVSQLEQEQRRFRIALDDELEPVSVALGPQSLPFRRVVESDGRRAVEFELAEPLSKDGTLRAVAWCPLRAGQRWALPRISLRDAAWTDGAINVMLPTPLSLTQLFPGYGLRQTKAGRLTAPLNGEALTFDCYSADARLELRVDGRPPQWSASSGTTLEVGARDTIARTLSDIKVANGDVFEIHGRIAPDWYIEDVRSETTQPVEEIQTDPTDPSRLTVRLKRSVSSRQSARLLVTARRLNPRSGEAFDLASFQPLTWEGARGTTQVFSLRTLGEQRWQLQLADGAAVTTREQLSAAESELLSPAAADETLVTLAADGNASALLKARPDRLRTSTVCEFAITNDELTERYVISCVPNQGAMDSLLVRFSHSRDSAPVWSIANAADASVTAKKLLHDSSDPAGTTETWQVQFWPPRSTPFVLEAERSSAFSGEAALALTEVPTSVGGEAIARVVADNSISLATEAVGPRPVFPSAALHSTDGQTVRAEYRYEAARDVGRAAPAALTVSAHPRPESQSQAIVRSESLVTTFTPGGACLVSALYRLDNDANAVFAIRLPEAARLLRLEHHEKSVAFRRAGNEYFISLTDATPGRELLLEYAIDQEHALLAGKLKEMLPRAPSTAHPREWELQLPQGWELVDVESPWECEHLKSNEAIRRFLGPLSWATSASTAANESAAPSIVATRISGPASGEPVLRVRSRSEARRYFVCTLALAAACSWRLSRWRPRGALSAPLMTAAAALVAPSWLIPWTAGAFLGSLLGTLFGMKSPGAATPDPSSEARVISPGSTTRTMVVGAMRVLVALLVFGAGSKAAETVAVPTPRVFVPVDADGAPTGDRYFVSATLWRELQRLAAAAGDEQPEWIITHARYTLGSREKTVDATTPLKAVMELQTFVEGARVSLPLGDAAESRWNSAALDGVPLAAPGKDTPADWTIAILDPGSHRVELSCQPDVTELHDHRWSRFPTFPVPSASLRTWCGAEVAAAEVDSVGEQTRQATTGLLTAELGPVSTIELRTARAADEAASRVPVELEQLLWLHVEPERVVAELRHQIVAADRPVGRLRLQFDPRWQALNFHTAAKGPRHEATATPGQELLSWSTPAVVGERFTWRAELRDRAGVGEIALPQVTPVGAVVRRRWCAVSFDPSLEITSLANVGAPAPSAAQFLASWGAAETTPTHVMAWPLGSPPPNLQTAFVQPVNLAEELVEATVRSDRLDVTFDATITTAKAALFQHRILASPDLIVKDVEMEQGGARRAVTWSRSEDSIHVFLPGPTLGPHRLLVQTTSSAFSSDVVELPLLTLADAEVKNRIVKLYRHRSVIVDQIQPEPRVATLSESSRTANPSPSLQVGEWAMPESRLPISYRWRANQPHLVSVQTTSLKSSPAGLLVDFDCNMTISDGFLDELRFEIADTWRGPFQLEPAWPFELVSSSASGTASLVVRPPQAIQGEQRLRVRGAAPIGTDGAATIPAVSLQGAGRTQRMVVLPDHLEEQRVSWTVDGLRPAPLPSGWTAPPDVESNWIAYEVLSDDYAATSRNVEDDLRQPRVRLADHTLRIEANGVYRGIVAWTLDPGGLSQLPLRLPPGAELLSCRIMGRRVDLRASAANAWLVPLPSDRLPQIVEVLSSGSVAMDSSTPAPTAELVDVPVSESMWTIIGPPAGRTTVAPSSMATQALDRYRAAAESVRLGIQRTGLREITASNTDEERWFGVALKMLLGARQGVMDVIETTADRLEARRTRAELDEAELALNEFLKDRPGLTKALAAAIESAPTQLATPAKDDLNPLRYAIVHTRQVGGDAAPVLLAASAIDGGAIARWLVAMGFIAATVLLARNAVVARAALALHRWRLGGWLMLGVAFWLWATPSILGPAIIVGAVWFAVRSGRLTQNRPEMAH